MWWLIGCVDRLSLEEVAKQRQATRSVANDAAPNNRKNEPSVTGPASVGSAWSAMTCTAKTKSTASIVGLQCQRGQPRPRTETPRAMKDRAHFDIDSLGISLGRAAGSSGTVVAPMFDRRVAVIHSSETQVQKQLRVAKDEEDAVTIPRGKTRQPPKNGKDDLG